MSNYEELFNRQGEIVSELQRIGANFDKDSAHRKTSEYLKLRLDALDNLWGEFELNNTTLITLADKSQRYFTETIYPRTKKYYRDTRAKIAAYEPYTVEKATGSGIGPGEITDTAPTARVDELLSLQRTNFRAFKRLVSSIKVSEISEKWELEDELRSIQSRWNAIDKLHLEIDNILEGEDEVYQGSFTLHEMSFKQAKKALNQKLSATSHIQQATPLLEIPTFTGKYTYWPTFFDLFSESIHNNNFLSKAQKMQHLKGKVKGEAERLIQHLNISAENYDIAWEILTHRYNNPQVLFTTQIETFLNQPNISKQTSFEIKRLYDTTTECIHAIHNLGVNTNTWDPILVHLLTKKLDSETYNSYKESRKSPRELPKLDELMTFLESKFIALEPTHKRERETTALVKPAPFYQTKSNYKPNHYTNKHPSRYLAASTSTCKCPLCNLDHELYRCQRFINMPAETKLRTVAKLQLCVNCLFKHASNKCTSIKRCKECNNDHHTKLHDAYIGSQRSTAVPTSDQKPSLATTAPTSTKPFSNKQHTASHVAAEDEEVLLATVLLQIKAIGGNYVTLRALLDQGSQITLISENAAQLLGLPRQKFSASVSGVGIVPKQSKQLVSLQCSSIYNDYNFNTDACIIPRVIGDLPNATFSKQTWPHIQHMKLADPEYNVSKSVDILLDASVYSDVIMNGLVKGSHNAPIAQQTKLGWILSGNVKTFNCSVVVNNLDEIAKYWELEEIPNTQPDLTNEEQYCEEHYIATTKRLEDGRYEVALPMKPYYEERLGSSKAKATAQFIQLENKMAKNQAYSDSYKQFIQEYQQLGHMKLANQGDHTNYHMPHHGVLKPESTTSSMRVVFNASSKTNSGLSLNDVMECGTNLQHDLTTLILNWRQYKYVITADIEKMFRQILIRDSDQHLQCIIWRESPHEPLQEHLLTTVTYGTKAAPYLAMRTLRQLAKDDALKFPLAATALENHFYMDDLLSGENTIEATKELQHQLIEILKGAGMNLRKWSANDPELLNDLSSDQLDKPFDFKCSESRKTLGLKWTPSLDSFMFTNKIEHAEHCNTKRQLLSEISKIFDPLGWLSPLTIRAKCLFQTTWSSCIGWDDPIPEQIRREWVQLRNDLQNVSEFSIPRYLGNIQKAFQLHGFSDASEKAYACTVYLVAYDHKGVYTSRLVAAKTKLAPLKKKVSLPRLELCGALLLAQLMKIIIASLTNHIFEVYAWTDSTVVLGWLHGDVFRWKQFVANRAREITETIPASNWNHVRSEENAADCATRGLSVAKLKDNTLWWNGPEWLTSFEPSYIKNKAYEPPSLETKKVSVNSALQQVSTSLINEILNNNSSITRAVKVVAWVSRYKAALQHKHNTRDAILSTTEINKAYELILSTTEINKAYELIAKHVQAEEFESDLENIKVKGHVQTNSKLANLCPYIDENGILRVGGRLSNSTINSSAKHPIILPSHSRFTGLIISQSHITTLHGGPRLTLSYLRERYWILSGMRTVKKQLRQCIKCRRFSTEKQHQLMADLPRPRVTPSRPFTHTGVDFTGHVDIKANKGRGVKTNKGYVAVFVCLATKAVHLELVSDLSTPAFLAAFRRFCARRGTPGRMYSDNGTNFIGAKRALDNEYSKILDTINQDFFSKISEMNVEWSFNAPAWPSAGGLWEAAVKSFKRHLKRVLGEQKLTYEEFSTLLQQIEACLNSRPLFPLTENPEDGYLTPGHFLIGDSLLSRPQSDPANINLPARWQLVQAMNKQFWKLWSSDYLQHLQIRSKWRTPCKNLEISQIVLIKDDNLPPGKWALGRVVDLHPGSDGCVRVVSLKTENKICKRPVTKVILLPIETADNNVNISAKHTDQQAPPVNSKGGRKKKRNTFKSYLTLALMFFSMLISPTTPHEVSHVSTSALNDTKALYFDRISNLQIIRDEWKLVVYYNLTSYWQAITNIEAYVNHLKDTTKNSTTQYQQITNQLTHELTEIEHYNRLLQSSNKKRQKRGLVNGVGSVANYLFGVLDDNFAHQYAKDIEKIAYNENHLKKLIKNQTVIIEAELNIIQRNEQIMNKQFSLINENLRSVAADVNKVRSDVNNGLYITSSSLAASIILENLRRMQTALVDTVTDISHGRIDAHLLTSEQLGEQINFISGQLQGDLKVPLEMGNIRDLYKLLKVSAKVYKDYLIIEIKVPLVSNEMHELDKIISIPQNIGKYSYLTIPTYTYLAFNLHKDTVIFLSEHDLQACLHASEEKILCNLDQPTYDLNLHQNICNLTLITTSEITSPCVYEHSQCVNRWIKLHQQNSYLYSCCNQCNIRTLCTGELAMSTLAGNGLINIGQGCILKADSFTIHSHNSFLRKVNVQPSIEAPEVSILNSVIKTSGASYNFTTENHDQSYRQVMNEINNLKQQSTSDLSVHDIHQYSISYGMLAVLILIVIIAAGLRAKRRRGKLPIQLASPGEEAPVRAAPRTLVGAGPPECRQCSELCKSVSMVNLSINKGTAPPKPPRSVSIPIPCEFFSETVEPTGDI